MEPASPPADARAGRAEARPRWYLLYYVLAALDLVAVLVSLTLSYLLMQNFVDSVADSQVWSGREEEYALLADNARAVNAPGNDVFDSRDVASESARLRAALQAFDARLGAARAEVRNNVRAVEAPPLLAAFDEIEKTMRDMVGEAELIFAFFDANQADRAGERMATMDRTYAGVNQALARLFAAVRTIRHAHFNEQIKAATALRQLEYLIVGLVVLMVVGALYYGSTIYRAMRAAEAERSRYVAALARALAEADAASRAKSEFLAVMSHEIRTPLNTIFLTLDMLEDSRPNDERQSYIAVARSSVRLLKRLVDDVLTLSRIEAGKVELESVSFELHGLLQGLLAPHAHRAATNGVPLTISIEPEVPREVHGDPTRFGEIVANLVDNAVKFTGT